MPSLDNKIGFVVNNLGASQVAYTLIKAVNDAVHNDYRNSICTFVTSLVIPCIDVAFPQFHLREAPQFDGVLIATDFSSALSIKDATRSSRYYYVNDLEWTRSHVFRHKQEVVDSVLKNDDIVKFARSEDHKAYMEDRGVRVSDILVEDFDIEKIVEIINDERRDIVTTA